MEELSKHGEVGKASLRAGMDRKTGRKYARLGKLPSELKKPRTWRTREDPFEEDWEEIVARLRDAPELEGKALFEDLLGREPGRYQPGQVRTFQRKIRRWRAQHGESKEVFFAQQHRPGEAMQTDFTWANELEITIGGEPFPHMLCHPVLPYSNWEWATVCRSESLAALKRGVQEAVFRQGRVAEYHQTDNSTAATHDLGSGKRAFNKDYEAFMEHLGMKPRTIGIGKKEQNGDVEALNGALKRRLKQHLLLRGSRDFDSVSAYEAWLHAILEKANALRAKRVAEDLDAMRSLRVDRYREYTEERVQVARWSTIRVKHNSYSVPARLIGEEVRVRIYDDRIEVYFADRLELSVDRLLGRKGHRVDYRHVIWSLVKKPGAFARYRYRDDLFPTVVFRQVYDRLEEAQSTSRKADIEYLRILHLAASTMESEVEAALEILLEQGSTPLYLEVKALVEPTRNEAPTIEVPTVDLRTYDQLLESGRAVAS